MPSMNKQNFADEGSTPPKSSQSTLDIHSASKPEATPAETLDPLKKRSRKATLAPKQEQSYAFITATILGRPVDLLVDLGACVSVIDAKFLQKVFSEETIPIIVSSTYPKVNTVSGENLPTIGQVEVFLSFHGKQLPCQFHVIENMTTNAVLGGHFLMENGAIINFANGTLSLHNTRTIQLSSKPSKAPHTRPLAALTVRNRTSTPQHQDEEKTPIFPSFAYRPDRFIRLCKKTAIFFLNFLIILLLMSSHGHASAQSLAMRPSIRVCIGTDGPLCTQRDISLDILKDSPDPSPKLLFPLPPVRLKCHRFHTVEVHHTTQAG